MRLRSVLAWAGGMLACGGGLLRADLVATSPFVTPGGAAGVPSQPTALELRGVMADGPNLKFSIFDPVKKSGTWVGLNEPGYDFAVKTYDAGNDTVTVLYQGRSLTVALRAAKIASSGVATAPVVPPPVNGNGPGASPLTNVTRNVVANPTPATEAARLADWQAEIQRRRELRAQQAQIVPGTPGPEAAPGPAAPGQLPRRSRQE